MISHAVFVLSIKEVSDTGNFDAIRLRKTSMASREKE